MKRAAIAVLLGLVWGGVAQADVRTDEKTQVKLEGMLGRMAGLFGGRAAREGVVSTVSVKRDRKMTSNGDTGQLIDLAEEKVYQLDLRKKTYSAITFAELRRQMEEARKKAASQAPRETAPQQPESGAEQLAVDVEVKETGQRRTVNGFDAREVVITVAVHEKGKTLEDGGGFAITSNTWLASTIANMAEVSAFDRRYAEKLSSPAMLDAQQMAALLAMYPMMGEAMAKFQAANVNMDGTPVMTVVRFEAVANQAQGEADKAPAPDPARGLGGLGAIGGRLGRRVMNRGNDDKPAAATAANRATVMTMQHELMQVSPTVSDADVAIPAGFTLER